jgi:hypothetical protein
MTDCLALYSGKLIFESWSESFHYFSESLLFNAGIVSSHRKWPVLSTFIIIRHPHSSFQLYMTYEVVSESSQTVTIVTVSVKEDERGGKGNTSASLLHQHAMWYHDVNTHCFYMNAYTFFFFFLFCFVCSGWQNWAMCLHQILREARQIRYQNPWNASWGFWRTFWKPDSSFWVSFTRRP